MGKVGRNVCCVHDKSLKCCAFFGVFQKCYAIVFIHESCGEVSEVEVHFCPLVSNMERLKVYEAVNSVVGS